MTMSNWYRAHIYVPCVPQRHVMCALVAVGAMLAWMTYYCGYRTFRELITHPYEHPFIPRSFVPGRCFNAPIASDMRSKQFAKVYWSQTLQRSVKQVFWLGYAVSSVASGLLMDVVGPRRVLCAGCLLMSLTAAILPVMAKTSPFATLCALLFSGIGLGVMNPCTSVVAAHWAPENERTFFVACEETSSFLGLILAAGLHNEISLGDNRWETWLYVGCVLNLVWILVWYILFYNRPSEHLHISSKELQLLKVTTKGIQPLERASGKPAQVGFVPWKQILLSPPFLSFLLLNFASCWTQGLLMYQMLSYITYIFGNRSDSFPSSESTSFQLMAVGIAIVSTLFHGWIGDKLISTGLTDRTPNRRFFLVAPNFISAILVFAIPFLGCERVRVVAVFFILIHFQGMGFAAGSANIVDLSPRYAGLLHGFSSAGQAMAYTFGRQLVDILVKDFSDRDSWKSFFQITAVILIIFSTPFLFFGSGEYQNWNYFCKKNPTQIELVQPIELSSEVTDNL